VSTAGLTPIGPRPTHDLARTVPAHLRALAAGLGLPAKRVRAGGDPEAIHDLRVATRRTSAALTLWSVGIDPIVVRRARRPLARLRRRLARTRELEVLAMQLAALLPGEPVEAREALAWAMDRLTRRVARGRARAARLAERARMEGITLRVMEAAACFAGDPATLVAAARHHVVGRQEAARATLALALEHGADDLLHEARIAVKRWRYAIESSAAATGEPQRETLRTSRDLQQCLGTIHDAAVMRDELARRARRARKRGRQERFVALSRLAAKSAEARRRALDELGALSAAVHGRA
jgi:CHAD domain-containing protein